MNSAIMIFAIILGLLTSTCGAREANRYLSQDEFHYIKDYNQDIVVACEIKDQVSAVGWFYQDEDSSRTVLTAFDLSNVSEIISEYQIAMEAPDSLGAILISRTDDRLMRFRLLNYAKPDSAFYANRLYIGRVDNKVEVDAEITLSQLLIYERY